MIHKSKFKNLAFVLLVCCILSFIGSGCSPSKKMYPTTKPKLEVLGFYEKGWSPLTYGYPSLEKHYQDINILIPYWYTVHKDGSLGISKIGFEQKVIDFCKKHPEIKLVPLINNEKDSLAMLSDKDIRTTAINNIVKKRDQRSRSLCRFFIINTFNPAATSLLHIFHI